MQKTIDITPLAIKVAATLRRWGRSYLEDAELYGEAWLKGHGARLY